MGEFSVWHWIIVLLLFVPVWGVLALFCNSLSKTLATVDPPLREQSPGSAWLLLIPLFGTIWMFFAVVAVRRGFERMTAAGRLSQPSSGSWGLGMALAVIGVLNLIPYVNLLTGLVGLVLFIIYWIRLVDLRRLVIPNGVRTSSVAPPAGTPLSMPGAPAPAARVVTASASPAVQSPHGDAPSQSLEQTARYAHPEEPLPVSRSDQPSPPPSNETLWRSGDASGSESDEDLFEQVAKELDSGSVVRSTWTRAFAEADGDDNRARAIYIRHRVARLQTDRAQAEQARVEIRTEQARVEIERAQHAQERRKLLALQNSVPLEKVREDERSPGAARLFACLSTGDVTGVREILAARPSMARVKNAGGQTALQVAVQSPSPAVMVRLLLDHGAQDTYVPGKSTALELAEQTGNHDVVKLLQPSSYARVWWATGRYRGKGIHLFENGTAMIVGSYRLFESADAIADAIDNGLQLE